ncbi:DUF397 domain-containing protein [Streptomyces sp. NPDC097981]|uniref:DUF397 domain-containing protein n=1 Tax=Streptomyces sp. NPDC097981 TaxID=3155428 RepID=UPI00332CF496
MALTNPLWRKSSYSNRTGGECLEVAQAAECIAVRDSKPPGPRPALPPTCLGGVFAMPRPVHDRSVTDRQLLVSQAGSSSAEGKPVVPGLSPGRGRAGAVGGRGRGLWVGWGGGW